MKTYILLILLLYFSSIKSQNNHNIPFNGKTEKRTSDNKEKPIISKGKPIIATYNNTFNISYFFTEVNDSIVMDLILEAPSAITVKKGDRLLFKTTKENIINLTVPDHYVVADNKKNTTSKWSTTVLLPISKTIYKQLSEEKVKNFLFMPEESYKIIMNKHKGETLKHIELCFFKKKNL